MPDHRLDATRDAVVSVVEPAALEQRTPFPELVERAVQRRHRRWRVAGVVVLCVAGAGLLLGKPVSDRVTAPPAVTPTSTNKDAPTVRNELLIQSLLFGSPDLGYAVVIRCEGPGYRCAAHATLLRTTDGARTWTIVPNPTDYSAGEEVRVDSVTSLGVVLAIGDVRYASTDGGVTWRLASSGMFPGPATESVPAGWVPMAVGGKLVALNPVTNQYRRLAHQPDFVPTPDVWPLVNGPSHRLLAAAESATTLQLAYSDDQGRTWHSLAAPHHPGSPAQQVLANDGTDRIYLAEGDAEYRIEGLYRLDHIGGNWTQVPVPKRVSEDPNGHNMKTAQLLPDGELLYSVDPPIVTQSAGTQIGTMPLVPIYGERAAVLYPNQILNGIIFSTLPPTVSAPGKTVAILVSTDSGHSWQLRDYKLP